jgi:hypothetical protein
VSLTNRDKKVVMVLVPLLAVLGYWFLLLSPQREAASKAGEDLTKQEELRDQTRTQLTTLERAKTSFAADYSQLVRLGKAVPTSVDMPSLIVQLDRAARGTGIKFRKIATGERQAASSAPPPAAGDSKSGGTAGGSGGSATPPSGGPTPPSGGTTPAGGGGTQPAAGGGAPAQSTPGQAGESAANNVNSANGQTAASADKQSGGDSVTPQDAQTAQPAKPGSLPVGGAAGATPSSSAGTSCAPGLECIPLEFEFDGGFFDLADFFHRLKRFVRVANETVKVRGRLLTIDGLKFSSGEVFPRLKAEVKATVYLAPKAEGTTAGATSQGPATTPAAGSTAPGGAQPAGSQPSPSPTTPTATATP